MMETRGTVPVMKWILMFILAAMLLVGHAMQMHVGHADNGDFSRMMTWITSGPSGFEQNWPEEGSLEYHERFYNNVLAFWKLDVPLSTRWVSSVVLLWLPGLVANVLLYSTSTVYLPFVSLAPRLLLLVMLLLLLRWTERHTGEAAPLFACVLGIPFVFFAVNTDYVAYFTSWYQEPASLTGLLFIVIAVARYFGRDDSRYRPWISAVAVLFLTSAKVGNMHWVLPAALVLIPWKRLAGKPRRLAVYILFVFILPLGVPLLQGLLYGTKVVNAYNSLFGGTLLFSDAPQIHLDRIGMSDASRYIGHHAYGDEARECMERYPEYLNHAVVAGILVNEPMLAWRMLVFAADSMQRTELRDFDKHVLYNRPDEARPWARWLPAAVGNATPLNTWSRIKLAIFPKGTLLIASLCAAALLFIAAFRSSDHVLRVIGAIGFFLAFGACIDMWMQVFGDGRHELLKHLFLANVAQDGVWILLPAYVFRVLQIRFSRRRKTWMEEWT